MKSLAEGRGAGHWQPGALDEDEVGGGLQSYWRHGLPSATAGEARGRSGKAVQAGGRAVAGALLLC